MPNFLNLKKKDPSDIVYVEKVILKNRTLSFELFRMLTIIAVASGIVWGISNADEATSTISSILNLTPVSTPSAVENITGIFGTVSAIDNGIIYLDDSAGSKYEGVDVFNIDLSTVKKVETNDDVPVSLSVSDIKVGDKIIARGIIHGKNLDNVENIISFSFTPVKEKVEVATTTATTTEVVASTTATTTEVLVASSTEATTTDISSSTPSILENISNTVSDVIGAIGDAAKNVVNVITGSSTPVEPVIPPVTEPVVVPEVTTPTPVVPAQTSEAPPAV